MTTSIFAVGDVFVDRPDPATAFVRSGAFLRSAGVLFGNCEGVFSDEWDRAPSSGPPVVSPESAAAPLAAAGFDVLSLANNHIVDGGHRGLAATRRTLHRLGIRTAGAGADAAGARAPAIVERDGIRIAFLAYSSIFPRGYEARGSVPGLAPLRARTLYAEPDPDIWDPGAAPVITTRTLEQDAEAFTADIARARADADVVAVSVHWGDMFGAFVVGEHERRTARLAVDSGADLVLGHHQHMLRGVEFHRGRPIFYGLGHYVFDLPDLPRRIAHDGGRVRAVSDAEDAATRPELEGYRLGPREGYPLLPFHPDGRLTGVAVAVVGRDGVRAAGFCPAVIGPENDPRQVAPESPDGRRVLDYLGRCCTSQGFAVKSGRPEEDSGLPDTAVQFFAG